MKQEFFPKQEILFLFDCYEKIQSYLRKKIKCTAILDPYLCIYGVCNKVVLSKTPI